MNSPTPGNESGSSGPNWIVLAVIGAFIVALAAGAVLAVAGGDDGEDGDTSATAANEADADPDAVPLDRATATIEGESLPPYANEPDEGVGLPAPTLSGTGLDGEEVSAPEPGRPTLMVFLAHWCPHCQVELPEASAWLAETELPDDVDVVAVATAIDPERPNYPAADWFREEGWEAPILGDADSHGADAYGLTALPYWVVVDADGNVVERRAGTQERADFDEMVAAARG